MSALKICMVTTFYPPYNFGGDGVFVQRLARALVKDGNEVHVVHDRDAYAFCSGDSGATANGAEVSPSPDNDGVHVHTLGDGVSGTTDLLKVHQLGRPAKKESQLRELLSDRFDVVHFHNVSLLGGPGVLRLGRGVKLCTLHDHWFVCSMHVLWRFNREACTKRTCLSCTLAGGRPPQLWRYTGAVADACAEVSSFISPSQFARDSHMKNGFPGQIRVLPHFIPDAFLAIDTPDGSVHPRPYFLFAGRLEKLKGVQFLIDQFRRYKAADLLIAGGGEYEAELKAQAQGLPHVHFVGKVSSQKLNALYKNAIAVLVPSLVFETFGLVALEAFAQGTPALVNNIGALPEIVSGGGGFVYNSGAELIDWMDKLRTDPSLRHQVGERALGNLKSNYTEQRHLTEYYAMIAELRNPRIMQEVR